MIDSCGRRIDYMRVSITDRCNLRCRYCMPEDKPFIEHDQILRYEEIIRICRAATKLGVRNIKITGGEPLVRRGCCEPVSYTHLDVYKRQAESLRRLSRVMPKADGDKSR